MNLKQLYSKKVEDEIKETLLHAEQNGRITIHEWRNFIDYDIIPLLRKYSVEEDEKRR